MFSLLPDKRLFKTLTLLIVAAVLLLLPRLFTAEIPLLETIWWSMLALVGLLAVADAYVAKRSFAISVERHLPGNFALGVESKVKLTFNNNGSYPVAFEYYDLHPDQVVAHQLPESLEVPVNSTAETEYRIKPIKRGECLFSAIQLRVQSPLQLWRVHQEVPLQHSCKIYPNFMAVANLNFLDYEQRLSHIGAHVAQRRGQGQDFKQLRDYQQGDEICQVDWKATSRQLKMISREYQDERDQEIIFMLDSGRRMRTQLGELSHFDHSLNALLLTSYIALSAGDAVGFMTFAGNQRWLKPVKGKNSINTLLNNLYDIHSSVEASDLSKGAESLMLKHQKRSLVIVITNLRDDDYDDLLLAVKLLKKKHLVMMACLKEEGLAKVDLAEQSSFAESLDYAATRLYLQQRERIIKSLKAQGVIIADATPATMHIALVNQYMALKRAGRI